MSHVQVLSEFIKQAEQEVEEGIPVAPFMQVYMKKDLYI